VPGCLGLTGQATFSSGQRRNGFSPSPCRRISKRVPRLLQAWPINVRAVRGSWATEPEDRIAAFADAAASPSVQSRSVSPPPFTSQAPRANTCTRARMPAPGGHSPAGQPCRACGVGIPIIRGASPPEFVGASVCDSTATQVVGRAAVGLHRQSEVPCCVPAASVNDARRKPPVLVTRPRSRTAPLSSPPPPRTSPAATGSPHLARKQGRRRGPGVPAGWSPSSSWSVACLERGRRPRSRELHHRPVGSRAHRALRGPGRAVRSDSTSPCVAPARPAHLPVRSPELKDRGLPEKMGIRPGVQAGSPAAHNSARIHRADVDVGGPPRRLGSSNG